MACSPTLAGHRPPSISILSSHEFFLSSFGLNSFAAQVGGTFWFSPLARIRQHLLEALGTGPRETENMRVGAASCPETEEARAVWPSRKTQRGSDWQGNAVRWAADGASAAVCIFTVTIWKLA